MLLYALQCVCVQFVAGCASVWPGIIIMLSPCPHDLYKLALQTIQDYAIWQFDSIVWLIVIWHLALWYFWGCTNEVAIIWLITALLWDCMVLLARTTYVYIVDQLVVENFSFAGLLLLRRLIHAPHPFYCCFFPPAFISHLPNTSHTTTCSANLPQLVSTIK